MNDALDIAMWNMSEAVQIRVHDWFAGRIAEKVLDGARSVRIPHPQNSGSWLKIKGAGYKGGAIALGQLWKTGPAVPVFDFDGRMMEDVASGHDNAYKGGASFQQAVIEYRVSRILCGLGYDVVPCIGYGRITQDGLNSWFSVFELDRTWETVVPPKFSIEEYAEAKVRMGRLLTDLAVNNDLIGHCWYVGTPGGTYLLKDLHPFRRADSINMSQVSWVMQVFFALHIGALTAEAFSKSVKAENVPEDLRVYPFRVLVPDVTVSEHDELRWELVSPYMLRPPESFSQAELLRTLRANRITSALLERCPQEYARP